MEKFRIKNCYTSLLDTSEFFLKLEDIKMDLFNSLHPNRKRDIKQAKKNKLKLVETQNYKKFLEIYANMMIDQGKPTSIDDYNRLQCLFDTLLKESKLALFLMLDVEGNCKYGTAFTIYKNCGCYLFGAGDKSALNRYDGSCALWESLKAVSRLGVKLVDLEGVNSPDRGAFKLDFGGSLDLYHRIQLNCN